MENPSTSKQQAYKGDSPRWAAIKEFLISGLLVMTGVDLLVDGALVALNRQKGESLKDYFKRDKSAVRFILLDVIVGVVAGIFQGSRAYRNAEKAQNEHQMLVEATSQPPALESDGRKHAEISAMSKKSSHVQAIAAAREQGEQADKSLHR